MLTVRYKFIICNSNGFQRIKKRVNRAVAHTGNHMVGMFKAQISFKVNYCFIFQIIFFINFIAF